MLGKNKEMGCKIVFALIMVCVLTIFIVAQLLTDSGHLKLFIKEGGVVETLSAVGYFLCVILMAVRGGAKYLRKYWYFVVMLLAFGLRELDFDKRFTKVGIFKSKFIVSPDVSLGVKLIGLSIIVFLMIVLVTILRKYALQFARNIYSMTVFELSIFVACVFLGVSKTLDGLPRKLRGFVDVSAEIGAMASNMEEAMEFGVPFLFILAVSVYFNRQNRLVN